VATTALALALVLALYRQTGGAELDVDDDAGRD
jgi:hypothetical protein